MKALRLAILALFLAAPRAEAQLVRFSTPSNATLTATSTTVAASGIIRQGFTTPGDAPPLTYVASNAPCSVGGGNGDNGSQVKSADGKCWLANFPASGADLRQWGVKFDGASDNSSAVQAALTWWALGNTLALPDAALSARFTTGASVTFPSGYSSAKIIGAGNSLLQYDGVGTALTVNYNGIGNYVVMQGFTLCGSATNLASVGLFLNQTVTIGNAANTAGTRLQNLVFRGCDGLAVNQYFGAAIKVTSVSNVAYENVSITGASSGGLPVAGTYGVRLLGSITKPIGVHNFINYTANYLGTGLDIGIWSQGIAVSGGSNFFADNNCISAPLSTGLDQLSVIGNQFNCVTAAIVGSPVSLISKGNLFLFNFGTGAQGISLNDTTGGGCVSQGDIFQQTGGTTPAGIVIVAETVPCAIVGDVFIGLSIGIWFPSGAGTAATMIANNVYNTVATKIASGGMKAIPDAPSFGFSNIAACAAALEGRRTAFIDSNTATWGATIAGGGANHVWGYCDGTNWTVTGK